MGSWEQEWMSLAEWDFFYDCNLLALLLVFDMNNQQINVVLAIYFCAIVKLPS